MRKETATIKYLSILILVGCSGRPFSEDYSNANINKADADITSANAGANSLPTGAGGKSQSRPNENKGGYGNILADSGDNREGGEVATNDAGGDSAIPEDSSKLDSGYRDDGNETGPIEPDKCEASRCPYSTYHEPPCCRNETTCGVVFVGQSHACIEWR